MHVARCAGLWASSPAAPPSRPRIVVTSPESRGNASGSPCQHLGSAFLGRITDPTSNVGTCTCKGPRRGFSRPGQVLPVNTWASPLSGRKCRSHVKRGNVHDRGSLRCDIFMPTTMVKFVENILYEQMLPKVPGPDNHPHLTRLPTPIRIEISRTNWKFSDLNLAILNLFFPTGNWCCS